MAVALTLMLATGTLAGIIHTGAPDPPPANPPSTSAWDPGSARTANTTDQYTSENSLEIVALHLLQTMLLVF